MGCYASFPLLSFIWEHSRSGTSLRCSVLSVAVVAMLSLITACARNASNDADNNGHTVQNCLDLQDQAEAQKQQGNTQYKARNFPVALEKYCAGLKMLNSSPSPSAAAAQSLKELEVQIVGNIAAVCLEQGRYPECIDLCRRLLEDDSVQDNANKLHARLSKAKSLYKQAGCNNRKKWLVAPLPEKGQGLIANMRFHPGDVIVSEKPIIMLRHTDTEGMNYQLEVQRQFSQLGRGEQKEVLSLCNSFQDSEDPAMRGVPGIYASNASRVSEGVSGLFPVMSRMNHSCLPNTNFVWREDLGQQVVIAIKEIYPGEELTDTYLPDEAVHSRQERHAHLFKSHRFRCECPELCRAQDSTQREENIGQLKGLKDRLNALKPGLKAHKAQNNDYLLTINTIHNLIMNNKSSQFIGENFLVLVLELQCLAHVIAGLRAKALAISDEILNRLAICAGRGHEQSLKWAYIKKQLVNNECKALVEGWDFSL